MTARSGSRVSVPRCDVVSVTSEFWSLDADPVLPEQHLQDPTFRRRDRRARRARPLRRAGGGAAAEPSAGAAEGADASSTGASSRRGARAASRSSHARFAASMPGGNVAPALRQARDYLRFQDARYAHAEKLETPVGGRAPAGWPRFVQRHPWIAAALAARLARAGRWPKTRDSRAKRCSNCSSGTSDPDLVLVTPLVDYGSYQTDYVKSAHRARRAGRRSCRSAGTT